MGKKLGLAMRFPVFNDCNPHQKLLPRLPDGQHANVDAIVFMDNKQAPKSFEFRK